MMSPEKKSLDFSVEKSGWTLHQSPTHETHPSLIHHFVPIPDDRRAVSGKRCYRIAPRHYLWQGMVCNKSLPPNRPRAILMGKRGWPSRRSTRLRPFPPHLLLLVCLWYLHHERLQSSRGHKWARHGWRGTWRTGYSIPTAVDLHPGVRWRCMATGVGSPGACGELTAKGWRRSWDRQVEGSGAPVDIDMRRGWPGLGALPLATTMRGLSACIIVGQRTKAEMDRINNFD